MSARTVLTFHAGPEQRAAMTSILAPYGGIGFLADAGDDPRARADMLGLAEAVITFVPDVELTDADLPSLGNAGLIQLLSAGANHVNFGRLPAHITVAGNVGAYADPMAEHVVAMALSLAKRLQVSHADLAAGTWDQAQTLRLRGGTVGVLGYGGIGQASAALFRAFGMRVYAINTSGRAGDADQAGTLADLGDMLASADILVITVPLTNTTRGLIGGKELGLMKPEAILVNVARGPIVDEDALFAHLQAQPRFGAAIDTWWDEPDPGQPFAPRLPFLTLPNVLGSPHNSGNVAGMDVSSVEFAARNVARFLSGEPPRGVQNPADYDPAG
ncbi:MAG TPA: 2-hydroxyacid dehydrogenase [Streptosporangiaceae bacterium]|jgi:glycerate dehydrogenase|nr:2-hydroxyacid dehydrogenase [Streptosporangiaceae bacterium]